MEKICENNKLVVANLENKFKKNFFSKIHKEDYKNGKYRFTSNRTYML